MTCPQINIDTFFKKSKKSFMTKNVITYVGHVMANIFSSRHDLELSVPEYEPH